MAVYVHGMCHLGPEVRWWPPTCHIESRPQDVFHSCLKLQGVYRAMEMSFSFELINMAMQNQPVPSGKCESTIW